jgi:hypothetical protein
MHTQSETEPTAPAVGSEPGAPAIPPADGPPPAAPRAPRRTPRLVAGALSALRGDKYMAGAYPPEWPPASTRAVALDHDDVAPAAAAASPPER